MAKACDQARGVVERGMPSRADPLRERAGRGGRPPQVGEQPQCTPPVAQGGEGPGGPGGRCGPGVGPVPVLRGEDAEAAVGGEQLAQGPRTAW